MPMHAEKRMGTFHEPQECCRHLAGSASLRSICRQDAGSTFAASSHPLEVQGLNACEKTDGCSPEREGQGEATAGGPGVSPLERIPRLIHSDPGYDRVALRIVSNRLGGHQAIFDGAESGATSHADDRMNDLARARPEVAYRVSSGGN